MKEIIYWRKILSAPRSRDRFPEDAQDNSKEAILNISLLLLVFLIGVVLVPVIFFILGVIATSLIIVCTSNRNDRRVGFDEIYRKALNL